MILKITSFNVENLFNRYVFLDNPGARYEQALLPGGVTGLERGGQATPETTTLIQRNNTARAILECQPDILAVVEVEDVWTLRNFNDEYLDGYFDRMILLQGNDGRGINVGLCVRYGRDDLVVAGIQTHVDELTPEAEEKHWRINRYFDGDQLVVKNALFSRDCLAVDINAAGRPLTFLVNHLKAQDGKSESDKLRAAQAARVAAIARDAKTRGRSPILTGDYNEHWHVDPKKAALAPLHNLVAEGALIDPFSELGPDEDWTYYYMVRQQTNRFDHILLDGALAGAVRDRSILRKAITLKCKQYSGERYPTIGYTGTEASDHCPVSVTLELDEKLA